MARTKKTTEEKTVEATEFVETKDAIEGTLDEHKLMKEYNWTVANKHYVPVYDYRVVPIKEVADFLYKGYTLVGGPVVRFNDLYQGIIRTTQKEASDEEYEAWRAPYK